MELEDRRAPNGFVALAQYDLPELGGNDDGFISEEDLVWPDLYVWIDDDADGISMPGEVHPIDAHEPTRLQTIPRENNRRDGFGNLLRFTATAFNAENHPIKMVDVFFLRLMSPAQESGSR